jgi:bifunctional non-homologous end joining protein LigD
MSKAGKGTTAHPGSESGSPRPRLGRGVAKGRKRESPGPPFPGPPSPPDTTTKPQDPLATYRKKRDFSLTPEPSPPSSPVLGEKEKKAGQPLEFVVQKHDATRMHYDVRLEIAGAMASWAVPKGPSYDPAVKRLAVETEDHPMDYNRFEGRIPNGAYGAGDVLLWDRGTYETVPRGQEEAMRAKGHIALRLFGEKLVGEWHLIKTHRRSEKNDRQWLLFKAKDALADPGRDIVLERPESIRSGKTATRGPRRVGASQAGKSAKALLDVVGAPMLAKLASQLDDPASYLYEIKYDGYRLLAGRAGSDVRLVTRKGNDWTIRFSPIAEAVARIDVRECVLDGEACVVDPEGHPSFADLQAWLANEKTAGQLAFAVFDLLWLDGRDLRPLAIEERKELLQTLLAESAPPLTFSAAATGSLEQIASVARASGLEGLVAKKRGSPYTAGATGGWIKIKFDRRQDCAIVGYVPLTGTTDEVGALLLAVVDPDKKLHFAGRVGTGFDARMRKTLARLIDPDVVETPPVLGAPRIRRAHWSNPKLVCEIRFANLTRDRSARAPSFLGLREDKLPAECLREEEKLDLVESAAPDSPHGPPAAARTAVKLSNPDKVLYPRDRITKTQIFDYYTEIAPVMLPHLAGRPLTLQRWPDGIDGQEWYQQNAPDKVPSYVRMVEVGPKHGNKRRIVADSVETLQWLANLASLTIHQWASHIPAGVTGKAAIQALGRPDYAILDLDPGDGTWAHLVEVARAVRALLKALEMPSAIKTSGKRGVHVVVPVFRGASHEEATTFAEKVASAVAKVLPKIATVERMKAKREGKLYIDYLQNGEGKTIVAPYTLRARDGAPVSTPIAWDELTEDLDPSALSMRVVLDRVKKHGDLFAEALRPGKKLPRVD